MCCSQSRQLKSVPATVQLLHQESITGSKMHIHSGAHKVAGTNAGQTPSHHIHIPLAKHALCSTADTHTVL